MKKRKSKLEQDFKINITAIIDCMVILIAYSMVSASFVAMGAADIDFFSSQPPPAAPQKTEKAPPEVSVTVNLRSQKTLDIVIAGKVSEKIEIPAKGQEWDISALKRQLEEVRRKWNTVKVVTITAQDSIQYNEIIRAIEATQANFPGIWLGEQT